MDIFLNKYKLSHIKNIYLDKFIFNQNIILNGLPNSGKYNNILQYIKKYFNIDHNFNISQNNFNNLIYYSSLYHYHIYLLNNESYLNEFLLSISNNNKFNFIFINNADKLSKKTQLILSKYLNKNNYIFILSTYNYKLLIPSLRNHFIVFRIQSLDKNNAIKLIKNIANYENIEFNKNIVKNIINDSLNLYSFINYPFCINAFQLEKYFNPFIFKINQLINIISKKKINELRKIIYEIYLLNINLKDVFIYLANYHQKYIKNAAKYELLINHGNKLPIYLEAFCLEYF